MKRNKKLGWNRERMDDERICLAMIITKRSTITAINCSLRLQKECRSSLHEASILDESWETFLHCNSHEFPFFMSAKQEGDRERVQGSD